MPSRREGHPARSLTRGSAAARQGRAAPNGPRRRQMNEQERGRIEQLLLRERGTALESIGHFDERLDDLRDRVGEISLYRLHPADMGSENNEQEQDLLLTSMEGRRLYQIDEA